MSENENGNKGADTVRSEKCKHCYWITRCMLNEYMQKKCGGPFPDARSHREYIEKNVVNAKKTAS